MQRRDVLVSTVATGAMGVAAGASPLVPRGGVRSRPTRIRTRDGSALFYREWGSGRPILFVHSLSLSSAMWSYQEAFLGDHGIRCISYDRRGHGRSDGSAPGLDLDTFADDLHSVIEGLDLRDPVVAGHSVGCGEIIRYIGRHGTSRIAKVIMLAPTTPYVLQTADNPYEAAARVFQSDESSLGRGLPQMVAGQSGGILYARYFSRNDGLDPAGIGSGSCANRHCVSSGLRRDGPSSRSCEGRPARFDTAWRQR